ncbi:hypothetical protein BU16DRAFT_454524 [Lophium mytilinum]|uniref:Uncharacterized protein n=1 Tax=Lophium mytilinum TaxID=390894 RepID=A0A6A6R3C6_9PEZI|nr:hypothetical protein BU16DRAFT_454524 [Lophium mytilinum]
MYHRGDPRWTRRVDTFVHGIESANESAQANLFTFAHNYIGPCLGSVGNAFHSCTSSCFPSRDDRRRHRGRSRGRAELSFDFYDDWEEDENDGLLGWGNDELDRLLAGSRSYGAAQPARQRAMSYGTRRDRDARFPGGRRKSAVQPHDGGPDPTIIPSSSYFGFLGRLPFNIGGKGLRYKPSAADLTEHPGALRRTDEEQPLVEDSDEDEASGEGRKGHRRKRSQTALSGHSGHTTDSLSSRGDLFPSEDEDDAIPLDDEFTMALERRQTGLGMDDTSSGKTKSSKARPAGSRLSTRTVSSRSTHESGRRNRANSQVKHRDPGIEEVPSLSDLKQEDERVRLEEEAEVERKRHEARQVALKRGLSVDHFPSESKHDIAVLSPSSLPSQKSSNRQFSSPVLSPQTVEPPQTPASMPFPTFDSQTAPESGAFDMEGSEFSSAVPTPNRPLSLRHEPAQSQPTSTFVPARLPHFAPGPD